MKSIFAITMMLAAVATSAEYMTESEAQLRQFSTYEEELMTEEEDTVSYDTFTCSFLSLCVLTRLHTDLQQPRRLGSKGWGGSKGGKGSSKGGKGSSKGSKGSSKGSKGSSSKSSKSSSSSEDCEPEIIYKYIYVPVYPPSPDDDDYSSGKSGKGSYGSGKSGKGWGGSGKSGKGSGGWGGSGKSGKGSGGWGGSGKSGKGSGKSGKNGGGWW
jgi:hypothetical protein